MLLFKETNTGFITANGDFDTSTAQGSLYFNLMGLFSDFERQLITERIRDNMLALSKTGRWLGGCTPLGYKSEKVESISVEAKKRALYKLDIISEEKEIVELIFSKYIKLGSLTKLETYLLNNNYKTRNKKVFSRFAIKAILQNPVYAPADKSLLDYFSNIGAGIYSDEDEFTGKNALMVFNKTLQLKTSDSELEGDIKQSHKKKEYTDWIVAVGKHIFKFVVINSLINSNT